jgi:predicted metallopeptidase
MDRHSLNLSTATPTRQAPVAFDFTAAMRGLCADLVSRLPELSHVDLSRVAIRFCQTRSRGTHGVQATLTPLRFAGGARETVRRGRHWTIQQILDPAGREMLYLLSFYLPRFCEHSFREKLATVCHELWHISPAFDGDLRRLEGRCYAHGRSERHYHEQMHRLAERWLALNPPPQVHEFLSFSFRQLAARYSTICGTRIASPKLVPLSKRAA